MESSNVGQCVWPCFQCGPAFCTSFTPLFVNAIKEALRQKGTEMPVHVVGNMKKVLGDLTKANREGRIRCLVPMAIDQAPYFRMARDVAPKLDCPKPGVIHSEFLPGLKQSHGKMSSTVGKGENGTLFLDMNLKDIVKTIKRYAFSGGRDTLEEHRKYGGDIKIDICYQYLTYFLESDEELRKIAEKYTEGTMLSGELKELTAKLISGVIGNHQKAKAQITDEIVDEFFNWDRVMDIGGCYDRSELE